MDLEGSDWMSIKHIANTKEDKLDLVLYFLWSKQGLY